MSSKSSTCPLTTRPSHYSLQNSVCRLYEPCARPSAETVTFGHHAWRTVSLGHSSQMFTPLTTSRLIQATVYSFPTLVNTPVLILPGNHTLLMQCMCPASRESDHPWLSRYIIRGERDVPRVDIHLDWLPRSMSSCTQPHLPHIRRGEDGTSREFSQEKPKCNMERLFWPTTKGSTSRESLKLQGRICPQVWSAFRNPFKDVYVLFKGRQKASQGHSSCFQKSSVSSSSAASESGN